MTIFHKIICLTILHAFLGVWKVAVSKMTGYLCIFRHVLSV